MINFSSGLIFLLGALAALGAAAIDMYLPSLPSIESELGGVSVSAQFTLSSFFIGLGVWTIILRSNIRFFGAP